MKQVQIVKISLKTVVLAGTVVGAFGPEEGVNRKRHSPAFEKLSTQVKTVLEQESIDSILMSCSGKAASISADGGDAC